MSSTVKNNWREIVNHLHYVHQLLTSSGVTTILSTAAVGLIQRDGLPRVPYATALDVFLNVCIFYNLAAIIQYSAVNYFTKILPKEGGASDEEDETVAWLHLLFLTLTNRYNLVQRHYRSTFLNLIFSSVCHLR